MRAPAYFGRMRYGYTEPSRWKRLRWRLVDALPKILIAAGAFLLGLALLALGLR